MENAPFQSENSLFQLLYGISHRTARVNFSLCAPPDHPQPAQQQVLIIDEPAAAVRHDKAPETARHDRRTGPSQLALHALDKTVGHGRRAVDRAGLQALDRLRTDHMRRRFNPDIRQLRRPGEERLHAELDARQNHAPAVAPLLVDHRDGRRRNRRGRYAARLHLLGRD